VSVGVGLALAGVSAVASSSAHAVLKSSNNKVATQAWSQLIGLLFALPFAFWVGLPERGIWIWLFAGWVLHTVYYLVLNYSYDGSDYSAAYPIARGVTPIVAAGLGIALLKDDLGITSLTGVLIISIGITLIAYNKGITKAGLLAAGGAGLLNGLFSITDAQGMRVAADPMNFIVWYYIVDGFAMPFLLAIQAKGQLRSVAIANARNGVSAGIFALFAFLPTLIAFRIAPVGAVSAIRATSVIFSLFLGSGVLRENIDTRRLTGALLVTSGAIAIIVGSIY
jgi:drug/metabolite transporter (DMT)-like permease